MLNTIRVLLLIEGITFLAAAAIHSGYLLGGYRHREAAIAETVIGGVLWLGLVFTLLRPHRIRSVGIVVQSFALLGTLVGIFTIIIGIGPQSTPDIVYHVGIVFILVAGIFLARRSGVSAEAGPSDREARQ